MAGQLSGVECVSCNVDTTSVLKERVCSKCCQLQKPELWISELERRLESLWHIGEAESYVDRTFREVVTPQLQGAIDPVLIQSPSLERVTEGQTARLQCTMRNAAVRDYKVDWYRERPGKQWESILTHYAYNDIDRSPGFSERFLPSRHIDSNRYILTISNVQPSDTAVYYCSVWGRVDGSGSRLNVTSSNAPVLIQSPSLERVPEGQTARLQCTMRNAAVTHTDVHWYRELPGKDTERVLTHDIKNNTRWSPGFTERFYPSRDTSNKTFILTISNMQPSDTAVYYCSVWGDISGNGSQLNVTSKYSFHESHVVLLTDRIFLNLSSRTLIL
ncbi:uncharacterized protein [Scyliorhinus torazame]|uniref:uncharacterized protein n=1 Tax=Scyliorhinus torazame TaxID=75743 RepID=UPI003B58EB64